MEAGEDRVIGDQAGAEAEGEAGSVARRQRRRRTAWEGREGVRATSPKMHRQHRPGTSSPLTLPNEGHTGGPRAEPGEAPV